MKKSSRIHEDRIPNGLVNGEVKHKKLKQPYTPPELFKLHTLAAFIGHRGSGKTHAAVNLTKKYLEEGSFNRVFIISPTYASNPVFHVLHVNEKDVYTNHHQSLQAIEDVLDKTKKDSDEYDDYFAYMKIYNKWFQGKRLTSSEQTVLDNNNHTRPPHIPRPSPLLIVDDMSHSDIYSTSRSNPFINLCLRHRHINGGKGISIFLCVQTFRSGIPLALRQNICQFFLWATHDRTQLDAIYSEVANLIDEETFYKLYYKATQGDHNFLTVDTNTTPQKQFRRNFDTMLAHNINHSDPGSDHE